MRQSGATGRGFPLGRDNIRPHLAGVCQHFLDDEGIDAFDCPACFPDPGLNQAPLGTCNDFFFLVLTHIYVVLTSIFNNLLSNGQKQIKMEVFGNLQLFCVCVCMLTRHVTIKELLIHLRKIWPAEHHT